MIDRLARINIVCGKSQPSFLKNKGARQTVVRCDELEAHIDHDYGGLPVEVTGTQIVPIAAQLAAAAHAEAENNAAAAAAVAAAAAE